MSERERLAHELCERCARSRRESSLLPERWRFLVLWESRLSCRALNSEHAHLMRLLPAWQRVNAMPEGRPQENNEAPSDPWLFFIQDSAFEVSKRPDRSGAEDRTLRVAAAR